MGENDAVRRDPLDLDPPKEMIEVAKTFLRYYVRRPRARPDVVDVAVDIALEEWGAWTGKAFNEALEQLGLMEDYESW